MKERWRKVPFALDYDVSDLGRVRSRLPLRNFGVLPVQPRLRKLKLGTDGYYSVILKMNNGNRKQIRVSRLVLTVWREPRLNAFVAMHRNNIKTDNRLSNLIWGTWTKNYEDAYRDGLIRKGRQVNTVKLSEEQVRYVKQSNAAHTELAKKFGTSIGAIWHIRAGRTWKHIT